MRVLTGVLTAAAVAVLAGCGGDDGGGEELSATAFRDRANAICRDLRRETEHALDGVDREDEAAMARAAEEAGRRTEDALEELGKLNGPDAAEAPLDRVLSLAAQMREALAEQDEALRDGDAAAAERAAAEVERLGEESGKAMDASGLRDCA